MARKRERSLVLVCVLFVFACLLLSGGSRLIGSSAQEETGAIRPFASIRAALCAPALRTSLAQPALGRESCAQQGRHASLPENRILNHRLPSDSNGNVLAAGTYMRAVYQAFVLDDGFV